MIDIKKDELIDLFNWVISPVIEVKNVNELETKLKERYYVLPERIWPYGKSFEYSLDNFLIELFQKIEYSNPVFFLILNKGRKYLHLLWVFLILFLCSIIFSLGTVSKIIHLNNEYLQLFILPLIVVILIIEKILEKLFDKILIKMKPGDLLKILYSKDEIVTKKIKIPTIKEDNIFSNPSVLVGFSKKKMICENYRKKMKSKIKTLYNLAIYFIATDYLINIEGNIETINYLREQAVDTLTYILAFRNDSTFTLYNLAIYELELMNIEESKKYFRKIFEIQNDNIEINAWINVLDFILINCNKDSNGA
jgi:hypothetical protein